ncbi:VOC family protein [Marinoscillum furvescens]|uniref:Lactoylglutathione lyase n=1 Tax=Marinoscillum furvescens DSM 4134 TaxID=1122208 RepID=A0A3D9LJK1_MARFU|nr:VOC family protein [Marinoscillum furvescens]REE05836.1 lactoylglutathione lyase [Marinoscillum furvescens DSM 4134]
MGILSQGLRTTIYKVEDLQVAKKWYSEAFGTNPYYEDPKYVGFNIAGYELGLLHEKVETPRTTNVLSYWGVRDITDAFDKMVTTGAIELEAPNEVGGGVKVALLRDPWQNVIGLIYNPHFQPQVDEKLLDEVRGVDPRMEAAFD